VTSNLFYQENAIFCNGMERKDYKTGKPGLLLQSNKSLP